MLNHTGTPMLWEAHDFTNGPGGTIHFETMAVDTEQETRVYGFWYLYHDPAYSIDFGELKLNVPVGFSSASAYLEHRKQLEMMPAPALRITAGGEIEFEDPHLLEKDQPLMMERFVVPSGWLDIQPFAREANGRVVIVKIRSVTPGTPIYKAGVREGEILRDYQGVNLYGLTEAQLRELMQKPLTSDLRLVLMASPQDHSPRVVVVPLAELRQALSSKK
jgi:hypothetical protein